LCLGEEHLGYWWNVFAARDAQSRAEIGPEPDFEFGAGFCQTNECVAAIAADITARAAADLAPGVIAR